MVLADTSIWIDHLRSGDPTLARLLEDGQAGCHMFILGELACGNLRNRQQVLTMLGALPTIITATNLEVLQMIDAHRLMGRGLGWVDMHLLAACLLNGAGLYTRDRRLGAIADELHCAAAFL